jgi:hypothetical protein
MNIGWAWVLLMALAVTAVTVSYVIVFKAIQGLA